MQPRTTAFLLLVPLLLASPRARGEDPLPAGAAAVVNGETLPLEDLHRLLMRRHGRDALTEMVLQRLIDQESRRLGVEVGADEIQARTDAAREELKRVNGREVVLEEALKAQGISPEEFRAQVVTRLTLEKLAVLDALSGNWARVRILVSSTEEKGRQMLEKLKAGADFAALAKQESIHGSAVNGGDLGASFKGELPPELEPFAFSAKAGDLSDLVRTPMGFIVARLDERQEAKVLRYPDLKGEVAKVLAKEAPGQDMLDRYLGRLRRAAKVQLREF